MDAYVDSVYKKGAAGVKAEINRTYSEVLRRGDQGEFIGALCAGDKILVEAAGKIFPSENEIIATLSVACLASGVVPTAQMTEANHAKAGRIVKLYGFLLDLVNANQKLVSARSHFQRTCTRALN